MSKLNIAGLAAAAAAAVMLCSFTADIPAVGSRSGGKPIRVTGTTTSEPEEEPPAETETRPAVTTAPPETEAPVTGTQISESGTVSTTTTYKARTTVKTTTTTATTTTTTAATTTISTAATSAEPVTTTQPTTTTAVQTTSAESTKRNLFQQAAAGLDAAADLGSGLKLRLPVRTKTALFKKRRFTSEHFPTYVYSNAQLKKALANIDAICKEYGDSISFAYYNIRTGAAMYYRPDVYYGTCSTIKAPYCAALLETDADLNEELTVNAMWCNYGSIAVEGGYGKKYTVRELIRRTIIESENNAYLTLVNRYGIGIFNDLNKKAGADYYLLTGQIFTNCTSRQLMKEYIHIYQAGRKKKRVKWLTQLMQKTDLETQITAQLADKYPVSHKYGSDWGQWCYHDCAVCYADSPFVLVIMTRQEPETPQSNKVFKRLAKQFDILNEQLAF